MIRIKSKKKAKAKNKAWLKAFLIVFIALMAGGGIYSFNAKQIAGNSLPMPFGVGGAVILSGSMEPELSVDDLVFVKAAKEYGTGDVIVFKSGRGMVIHRIISIKDKDGNTQQTAQLGSADGIADSYEIITKGDANNAADDPITLSMVIGKKVGCIKGGGKAVNVLQSPFGVLLLLGAVVLFVMSVNSGGNEGDEELMELRKEIERLKNSQGDGK